MLKNIFAHLPDEIVRKIVCYTDAYKERNGKLMQQISKYDPRYAILQTIHSKIKDSYIESNINGLRVYSVYVILKINYITDWSESLRDSTTNGKGSFASGAVWNIYFHIRILEITDVTLTKIMVVYRHFIRNMNTGETRKYCYYNK